MKNALPRIVPRPEHPISRRLLNPNAVKTLYRLRDNGFTAYLVGGCVRDLLLGREPKDFDIATSATPGQVKRLFRNCRLVGRRFRLAHLHFNDGVIEVATFRANAAEADPDETEEPPEGNHRHPQVLRDGEGMILRDNLFGTPEEDAWRRDFTVNALCYDIADFSIIDYVGGLEDLQRGVIRTIGDPWQRFTEDPVRMIRAIRFAALLGFRVEENSWQALVELAPAIGRAAPPRLYEEVLKLFLSGEGEQIFQLLRQSGLFTYLLPPLGAWLEREEEGYPHVWLGKALDWVDRAVADGTGISAPLLLTLLFGEYLTGEAERQQKKLALQPAMDRAMATLLEELSPVVLIPNRVAVQMREILISCHRFHTIPGRRAQAVVARPTFNDALQYLRFQSSMKPEEERVVSWWERQAAASPVPATSEAPAPRETGRKRRRPRRRNRRRDGADAAQEGGSDHGYPPAAR